MTEENKNLLEEIDKRFNEKTEEIKRHFDVSLEHMDERFDAIIEEQGVIKEKVEKIDLLVEDMDYVKSNLVDKNERFKEIDEVAGDHEKRIVKLENTALAKV